MWWAFRGPVISRAVFLVVCRASRVSIIPATSNGASRSATTELSPRLSGTWRCPRITARSWVIAATGNTCPVAVRLPCNSFPSIAAAGRSPAGAGWVTARAAALLTLGRFALSGGDHRCRAVASDDVGGGSAGRRVEGVAVQAGQDAPEGPFAGHQVPAA